MLYSAIQRPRTEQIVAGALTHLIDGLTVIYGRVRLAEACQPEPAVAHQLQSIQGQVERLTQLAQLLDTWAGSAYPPTELLDLNTLIRRVTPACRDRSPGPVSIEMDLGDVGRVVGSRPELEAALGEIIMNALEAEPQSRVCIRTRQESGLIHIEIEDDGVSLPPDSITLAYQPFYTTKTGHFGLGLNVAGEVMTRHRGDIRFDSEPGAGTRVILSLPRLND